MSAIDVYEVKVSMIWSIKTISNSVSPCFTFWVIWMSASDGSVFPLGWLCIMITFEALHINAPCSSSFVFTNVAFVVPFASCINPIGRLFWFRYPTHISSWCSIISSGKIALKNPQHCLNSASSFCLKYLWRYFHQCVCIQHWPHLKTIYFSWLISFSVWIAISVAERKQQLAVK